MSLQDERTFGSSGDIVCRKTIWTDVVKFFLFNYGLHAVTVISSPGAGNEVTAANILAALICPMSGVTTALGAIASVPILVNNKAARARRTGTTIPSIKKSLGDKLARAHIAGALCMLVPWKLNKRFGGPPSGFQGLQSIHGQIPFPRHTLLERLGSLMGRHFDGSVPLGSEEGSAGQCYGLVRVPRYFEVYPLLEELPEGRETELSYDYSIIKPLAAILQILYGSFELYEARGSQIDRFGYAAYSFTVIPYIVMSFFNLIASMCRPSYPCLYIVHYGDKIQQTDEKQQNTVTVAMKPVAEELRVGGGDGLVISEAAPMAHSEENEHTHEHECARELEHLVSGAVGCAHIVEDLIAPRPRPPPAFAVVWGHTCFFFGLLILMAPTYIIIYLLSNFDGRESTTAQRVWIISSLVVGNASWIIVSIVNSILYALNPNANKVNSTADSPWRGLRRVLPSEEAVFVFRNIYITLLMVPSFGAFVVVAQMMMGHETCIKI